MEGARREKVKVLKYQNFIEKFSSTRSLLKSSQIPELRFNFQASDKDIVMIMNFKGEKPFAKLPGLISTLMEEEKEIKERYNLMTCTEKEHENEEEEVKEEEKKEKKEAKEENEEDKAAVTLTENVLCENWTENRGSGIGNVSFDQSESFHEQDNNTYLKKGPEKNPAVEAKIKELYSVLLQCGDEERIRDFQKFMLNKQRI